MHTLNAVCPPLPPTNYTQHDIISAHVKMLYNYIVLCCASILLNMHNIIHVHNSMSPSVHADMGKERGYKL